MTAVSISTHESDEAKAELNLLGFQSAKAKVAATKPKKSAEEAAEPVLAECNLEPKILEIDDSDKLVRVRVRENIMNMRVGLKIYSLTANKEALVPKHVQRHLEERNLL